MNDSITVLAGGWSASQFNLKRLPGFVIGVNDSGLLVPCDYVLSMDRLWTENRWPQLAERAKPTWLRASTLQNVDGNAPWVMRYTNELSTELSDDIKQLNGTHSGFCALNLAYCMRPKRIYLVGFDMARGPHGETHWYQQYAWSRNSTGTARLKEWATQFVRAKEQLDAAGIQTFIATHKVNKTVSRFFTPVNRQELECAN